jgi:excinuclease ABC subunit C
VNVLQRDDKSFLYLIVTNEAYPKPLLLRERDFRSSSKEKKFLRVFGPYTSAKALRTALDLSRKIFPWSTCEPHSLRPCFSRQLGRCPGVCTGEISQKEYKKIIRRFVLFFEGKTGKAAALIQREMKKTAKELRYEDAGRLKRQLFALQHIQDVALIERDRGVREAPPRLEGYDISHISGAYAVGSMVVFTGGQPNPSLYRRFRIKTVKGVNDVAMLQEVLRRRFRHGEDKSGPWFHLPDLLLVDGGLGQVKIAEEVLQEIQLNIPVVGMAKGYDRKQDRLVLGRETAHAWDREFLKPILQHLRDEAHRFAVNYHRFLRAGVRS